MSKEEKKQQLKDELGGLLKGFDKTFGKHGNEHTDNLIDKKLKELNNSDVEPVNFEEMDNKFKSKAKGVITSMFDFYLDFGVIDKPDYLQRKRELDASNISNIFLQLKMIKTSLYKIMDEITTGNRNERMFEAFSSINNQFSEAIKAQANYVLFLEESYKKIRYESNELGIQTDKKKIDEDIANNSDYYLTANPKSLIREITENTPVDIEDVKPERSEKIKDKSGNTHLTDPHNKEDLMEDMDVETVEKNTNIDDYDNILDMI